MRSFSAGLRQTNRLSAQLGLMVLGLSLLIPVVGHGERRPVGTGTELRNGTGRKLSQPCRDSIDRGTQFLLSALHRDGSLGTDRGHPPDLSCTALFGMVLISQGNTLKDGVHAHRLQDVLDSVLHMSHRAVERYNDPTTFTLVQRKIGRGADLFIATLFLTQIVGEAGEEELAVRAMLKRLIAVIGKSQRPDGTWGSESWAPVLGTVLGWQCLHASSLVGFSVEASATNAGEALMKTLRAQITPREEQSWMHSFYKDAASIRVLYSLKYSADPLDQQVIQRLLTMARDEPRLFSHAGGEEYLAFFLVTECLLQEQRGSRLQRRGAEWYPLVRDKILRVQNADGSWS